TCEVKPLGDGLINSTWLIREPSTGKDFVFQKINHNVFKQPEAITSNIRLIDDYLAARYPEYLFTSPVKATNESDMIKSEEGDYYRLFAYVQGSYTHNELKKPVQAYEAARQFGKFTNLLSEIEISQLKNTIPDFHNLALRFAQFTDSLKNAEPSKYEKAKEAIVFLVENRNIVDEYKKIIRSENFKLRVTHHDTKISNVLFDKDDNGLCVIDLDTIMPGYFISDMGDMMRTYLSPVSEEEKDFSKIEVRIEFFHAIVKGYLHEMKNELSKDEKQAIIYSGKSMIYMQALRFITDYLNNDIYYGSRYEGHNLVRGLNQVVLLEKYMNLEPQLKEVVSREIYG
ncbi:MAG: aminoglycoside phosphotransferase family protein, partial [Verrucomicrobia bacterium]|nr:aminoglycoside phosphotransferase family protein [Prolixibacteraceae bacterium]